MKIFGLNIEPAARSAKNKNVTKTMRQEIIRMIEKRSLERTKATIDDWRNAVVDAENTFRPNRVELLRVIKEVEDDPHLVSVMTARKNAEISTDFHILNKEGEFDEKVTENFAAEWFFDFLDFAIESRFYGYSLIELKAITDDKFDGVKLVPREYVVPEKRGFKKNISAIETISFDSNPYDRWSVFVGNETNLGLIAQLVPYLIFKKDVFSAWSEYADLFGMPIRTGKTDVMNDKKRANMEEMLENMGAFGWASLDKNDEIELIESNNRDAFKVFQEMINTVDAQVSKMVLGQTGTTDEKTFVGSAEVHERVANMYAQTDRRFIEYVVNNDLLPLMRRHGIIADGLRFEFDSKENLSIMQQTEIVSKLSQFYQFDTDELGELLGFTLEHKAPETPQFMNRGSYISEVQNLYDEALKSIKK